MSTTNELEKQLITEADKTLDELVDAAFESVAGLVHTHVGGTPVGFQAVPLMDLAPEWPGVERIGNIRVRDLIRIPRAGLKESMRESFRSLYIAKFLRKVKAFEGPRVHVFTHSTTTPSPAPSYVWISGCCLAPLNSRLVVGLTDDPGSQYVCMQCGEVCSTVKCAASGQGGAE